MGRCEELGVPLTQEDIGLEADSRRLAEARVSDGVRGRRGCGQDAIDGIAGEEEKPHGTAEDQKQVMRTDDGAPPDPSVDPLREGQQVQHPRHGLLRHLQQVWTHRQLDMPKGRQEGHHHLGHQDECRGSLLRGRVARHPWHCQVGPHRNHAHG